MLLQREVAALQQGKLEYALQQLQYVLKHPGADVKRRKRNHLNMACVLDELQQPLDAIVCMSAVLALDENDHHAQDYRSQLYSRLGDCSKAIQVSLRSSSLQTAPYSFLPLALNKPHAEQLFLACETPPRFANMRACGCRTCTFSKQLASESARHA